MPRAMGGRRVPRRLTIVLAPWCPHCVPLSVTNGRRLAKQLRVPLRILDIDQSRQEKLADALVRAHGDASPDYLIPQVFLEWSDGGVQHLLTGFSEQVARTARAWADLFGSDWLRAVRREARA
jgi:glutaredoxin